MMREGYDIVIDFDGTVVKHRYPAVGEDIGAAPVLHKLVKNGCNLLLSTMRSRNSGGVDTLQPALDWFQKNDIPLYGINENPSQKAWTSSPKVHGNIYIDDSALGAPLKIENGEAFIDWNKTSLFLLVMGLLTEQDILDLIKEGVVTLDENKKQKI